MRLPLLLLVENLNCFVKTLGPHLMHFYSIFKLIWCRWAQIGIKLGSLGSYDILLPCRLDAFLLSESRNLYRCIFHPI